MTLAMVILGTIGWFIIQSGQSVLNVVFWRCIFGAATLLVVCAALGLFRKRLSLRFVLIAALGGVAIVLNWLLLFNAYTRASISIATAVYNTQPFILRAAEILPQRTPRTPSENACSNPHASSVFSVAKSLVFTRAEYSLLDALQIERTILGCLSMGGQLELYSLHGTAKR